MFWSVHLEGGPRRVNHAAVAVDEKIYSFGGYCTGDNYKDPLPIDVFVLNTHTFRWREIPRPTPEDLRTKVWPSQRYGHTVCHYKGQIIMFGGRNDMTPCNKVYSFDPTNYSWTILNNQGVVSPRDGHTACVINDALYIFGGYEESWYQFTHDVYKLDLKTNVWTLLHCQGNPPPPRDFHTATAIGERMYVFGGRSDQSLGMLQGTITEFYHDELTYLDVCTLTWHTPEINPLEERPGGRRSHSAVNIDGKLMIFGGFNGKDLKHFNDLWIYEPDRTSWTQIFPHGNGPEPRRRQTLILVGHQVFIFGGTSPYNGPQIMYTEEQLQLMQTNDPAPTQRLIDHNDLYVLELQPTLRTICLTYVIKNNFKLDLTRLPFDIQRDVDFMTKNDTISKPLVTLPVG